MLRRLYDMFSSTDSLNFRLKSYAALVIYGASMVLPIVDVYAATTSSANVSAAQKNLSTEYILHVMHKGDTLESVAKAYSTSADDLGKINKVFGEQWMPKALLIPSNAVVDSSTFHPAYNIYTLEKGETLSNVAARYNRSVKELTNLNKMVMPISDVVGAKEGSRLLVPAIAAQDKPNTPTTPGQTEQKVASTLSTLGESLSDSDIENRGQHISNQAINQASGMATSAASQGVEDFLNKKGTAKAGISARIESGDVDYSLDYLHPLLESQSGTLFTQGGIRTSNDRTIGNLGVGYREAVTEGMVLGANMFVDQDFSRGHTRGSIGGEAWVEAARLSANVYTPLSGWKNSKDDELNSDPEKFILQERPAKGWDVNLEGPVPGVPQLAMTAGYFQWKGDKVDVQGSGNDTEKDPNGYSVGVKWQPVPLVGFSAEHTKVSGSDSDLNIGMNLTWSFDRSMKEQLDSAKSFAVKPLAQARKELVQRNNEMVLEYREKNKVVPLAPLVFPVDVIQGQAGQKGQGPAPEGVQAGHSITYSSSLPSVVAVHPKTGYLASTPTIDSPMVVVTITATEVGGQQAQTQAPPRSASYRIELKAQDTVPSVSNLDITGTLQVGKTLTGSYAFADNDGNPSNDATNDASILLWSGGGTPGNNTRNYTLTAADVGSILRFSVKAQTVAGTVGALESITTANAPGVEGGGQPPGSVVDGPIPSVSNLDIVGVLQVGQTLKGRFDFADNDGDATNDAANNASTVVWEGGGTMNVTTLDYLLTDADVGKVLTFKVTPKVPSGVLGTVESITTANAPGAGGGGSTPPGSIVDPIHVPSVSELDIVGVLEVGQVLTGSYVFADNDADSSNDASNDASTFLWSGGGTAGNIDKTYTLTALDTGKVLTFSVTPKTIVGTTGLIESVTTANAPGVSGGGTTPPGSVTNPAAKPEVSNLNITGTLEVGQQLVGSYVFADNDGNSGNDSENDASALLWEGGTAGNQTASYPLTSADIGKIIAFNVTAKNVNGITGNTERVTTAEAPGVGGGGGGGTVTDPSVPTKISIYVDGNVLAGHPVVGQVLEARPECETACSQSLVYQWEVQKLGGSGYEVIGGATSSTYTVLASQQKRQIKVSVSNPEVAHR